MANQTSAQIVAIATETLNAIKSGLDSISVYWSWGVSELKCCEYEGMPTLMMKVSGLYHKGWVYVSLNQGADYYEVRLMTMQHTLKHGVHNPHTDICFEDLGPLIDRLIERGDTSEEEYRSRAWADSMSKMTKSN